MIKPAYQDHLVTLYHGDCREILPSLGVAADLVIADPPYGQTTLAWDAVVEGWQDAAAHACGESAGLWLWGSLDSTVGEWPRMIAGGWKRARGVELFWRKATAWHRPGRARPNLLGDRPNVAHEMVTFWTRSKSSWNNVFHEAPRIKVHSDTSGRQVAGNGQKRNHLKATRIGTWTDTGERFADAFLNVPLPPSSLRHHETQKPEAVLRPLITYGCPVGGLVLSPFAGSGSDLRAARSLGRRAIGCEKMDEKIGPAIEFLAQSEMCFHEEMTA